MKHLLIILIIATSFIACKKEEITSNPIATPTTINDTIIVIVTDSILVAGDSTIIIINATDTIALNTDPTIPTVTNSITGRVWMDRNLGATRAPTNVYDPAAYGSLYQWGRKSDGHQSRTSETISGPLNYDDGYPPSFIENYSPYNATNDDWLTPQRDDLWQGVNGINNPCPEGFRVPTISEWDAEMATWGTPKSDGAFASVLKLTNGGYRDNKGDLIQVGMYGVYWASSTNAGNSYNTSNGISFQDTSKTSNHYGVSSQRVYGKCVRCIQD